MKNIMKSACALFLIASLIGCNDPKPEGVPVEPQTQTQEYKTEEPQQVEAPEKKNGVNINVDADDKKVGVESDDVNINVDGEN